MAQEIAQDLLEILVCPETKLPVVQEGDWLVCSEAQPRRRYPIRDGIPVMLVDEAEIEDGSGQWVAAAGKAEGEGTA